MTHAPKILIVEDEAEIRNMLDIFFGTEDLTVLQAETGKSALRQIVSARPDLIVLDLGLPDVDGQDIITAVRQFSNVPIIVLSARADDQEIVKALNSGADDYVIKPFRAEILLARVQANLRQGGAAAQQDLLENGPISVNRTRHEVRLNGQLVAFTPKEFSLLEFFLNNRGRMLTHKQILEAVWGPAHRDDTQYLRVYIGQTRTKLETIPGLGNIIKSESGIGYKMDSADAFTGLLAAE